MLFDCCTRFKGVKCIKQHCVVMIVVVYSIYVTLAGNCSICIKSAFNFAAGLDIREEASNRLLGDLLTWNR